jgi:hypothetical protein
MVQWDLCYNGAGMCDVTSYKCYTGRQTDISGKKYHVDVTNVEYVHGPLGIQINVFLVRGKRSTMF